MPNPHRGEISARLGDRTYRLRLSLGALAEVEEALGLESFADLATRFQGGKIRAHDIRAILGAGLRGAGHDVTIESLDEFAVEGGAAGYVSIVTRLLEATFGGADVQTEDQAAQMTSDDVGREACQPGK